MKTDIAIIGNGCAAIAAIEGIRQSGYTGRLDVFSNSSLPACSPMLTTYYLSGKIPYEQMLLLGGSDKFYQEHDVKLHLNTPIMQLKAKERRLTDAEGQVYEYEQCLVASGAVPFVPPIEGAGRQGVFTLRTAEDTQRIKAYREKHPVQSALVVGASMVGIKAAEYLLQEQTACCLADSGRWIFPRSAHPNCAAYMESAVRAQGLELRLGGELCKIRENGAGLAAYFTDSQEPVYADLILLCIGVRPNLSFVSPDEVKMSGGILVDSRMRTNQAGLYAAGDCTAGYDVFYQDNRMIGLMANARMQGRTAGRNMAGMADSYCGSTPHNITHFMGMDFVAVGEPMAEGNVFEQSLSDNRYFRIVWEKGRLLSVNLLNMPEIAGLLKNLFFKSQGVQMLSGGVQNTLEYEELVSYLIKKYRNERIR